MVTNVMQSEQSFSGFGLPEKNFTEMPNELIKALPIVETLAELKVLIYILRHTWGYQEFVDGKRITLDEFEHGRKYRNGDRIDTGVGMVENSIRDGLGRAEKHGFITIETDDRDLARIEKYYSLVILKSCTPEYQKLHPGVPEVEDRSEKETIERNLRKDTFPPRLTPGSDRPISESNDHGSESGIDVLPLLVEPDPETPTVKEGIEETPSKVAEKVSPLPPRLVGSFNPTMLQLAIDVRSQSIASLVDATGINGIRISAFLSGSMKPVDADIDAMAKALDFPSPFFFREGSVAQSFACSVDEGDLDPNDALDERAGIVEGQRTPPAVPIRGIEAVRRSAFSRQPADKRPTGFRPFVNPTAIICPMCSQSHTQWFVNEKHLGNRRWYCPLCGHESPQAKMNFHTDEPPDEVRALPLTESRTKPESSTPIDPDIDDAEGRTKSLPKSWQVGDRVWLGSRNYPAVVVGFTPKFARVLWMYMLDTEHLIQEQLCGVANFDPRTEIVQPLDAEAERRIAAAGKAKPKKKPEPITDIEAIDPVFRAVCRLFMNTHPVTTHNNSKVSGLVWALVADVVNAEKALLGITSGSLDQPNRVRLEGELVGMGLYFDEQCKKCTRPRDREKFGTLVLQWYNAGKPNPAKPATVPDPENSARLITPAEAEEKRIAAQLQIAKLTAHFGGQNAESK